MKEKHILIFASILLVLVSYYALFEHSALNTKKTPKAGPPIFLISPSDVKKIHVWSFEKKELLGERKGYGWDLTKGTKTERWQGTLTDFVFSILMTLEIEKFPVENNQLNSYGLVSPRYRIVLTDITDKTYQLLVGETTPVNTSVYVKFIDSPNVIIVGALLNYEIQKIAPLLSPAT